MLSGPRLITIDQSFFFILLVPGLKCMRVDGSDVVNGGHRVIRPVYREESADRGSRIILLSGLGTCFSKKMTTICSILC